MNQPETFKTFTLGVTGGIGSGKTLVCELFSKLGARVIQADIEAKRLMAENPDVREEIVAAFGPASYHADGSLNRTHLAQRVFGDEKEVEKINNIVHPRMAAVFYEAKSQAEKDRIRLLVYEAALIYESGSAERLDAVAVVHTPVKTRIQRAMQRDGVSADQIQKRMTHQFPPDVLLEKADYVIYNAGTIDDLEEQVQNLYNELCHE